MTKKLNKISKQYYTISFKIPKCPTLTPKKLFLTSQKKSYLGRGQKLYKHTFLTLNNTELRKIIRMFSYLQN